MDDQMQETVRIMYKGVKVHGSKDLSVPVRSSNDSARLNRYDLDSV